MNRREFYQQVILAVLVTLLLAGCGGAASPPTPIPPTATPTAVPPTPTPTVRLATSIEEIAGAWEKISGAGYIRFNDDGTFDQARSLGGLDSRPFATCEFWLEGSQMTIGQCRVFGVPPCTNPTASYEIWLLEGNRIEIVAINDSCSPRRNDTATVYQAAN
jgi:hypothetical protein